jgi:tRNA pseudouridine55 synthase
MSATARQRIQRRPLNGVLLLDKPLGLSSNDALQKAKWLLRAEKAGHTGTLDPLATGLLPLCFGAATKFSHTSLDADKYYTAEVRLGLTTQTGDAEGEPVQQKQVRITAEQLQQAVSQLVGTIQQVPPMHSALKKDGKPLYAYARAGMEVEREARTVCVHALNIHHWNPLEPEALTLGVHCSKGTYVRTLAQDLGELLGCGASLKGLRRTGCGHLRISEAITLEQLEAMVEAKRVEALLPVDTLLAHWPKIQLSDNDAGRFITGLRRRVLASDCSAVRVYGPFKAQPVLLGSAHIKAGELIPDRLLSPPEIQAQTAFL